MSCPCSPCDVTAPVFDLYDSCGSDLGSTDIDKTVLFCLNLLSPSAYPLPSVRSSEPPRRIASAAAAATTTTTKTQASTESILNRYIANKMGLTPEQLTLVQSSWSKIDPTDDATADLFYDKLFELDPELRPLFPFDLLHRKTKLLELITLAVKGLDNLEHLVHEVEELGRHRVQDCESIDSRTVSAALHHMLENSLGEDDDDDDWDEELKEAWTITYGVLSKAMIDAAEATKPPPARIAVIGCGWWSQGWHLPHLAANAPRVEIAAIVDASKNPVSTLSSSPLLSISDLSEKYDCPCFDSVSELLADPIGPKLDGVIVATSHASHFDVGMSLLNEGIYRRQIDGKMHRALSILMEKPMTTDVDEARRLWETSTTKYPEAAFIINHTASYRPQTQVARHIIASHQIGKIRHISASMNGPLMWLFDDPKNHSWVSKTPWKNKGVSSQSEEEENNTEADEKAEMDGNGYAWGQIAHTLAWIYQVIGADDVAVPKEVYCTMTHAPNTGADIALAAVITCRDGVVFSLTGTALLPGSEYADPPVGKHIRVEVFGDDGCLMYGGNDRIPESGRLEVRKTASGTPEDGQSEYPCSADRDWSEELGADAASGLKDGFYFEDGEPGGKGPGSMKAFLDSCTASSLRYFEGKGVSRPMVNDSLIGLRTVQIIHCMYRSSISGRAEKIDEEEI